MSKKDDALAAVQQNGLALWGLSERLKNDRDIAVAAVKQNKLALEYVSQDLLKQHSDIFGSVRTSQNPSSLWFISGENGGSDPNHLTGGRNFGHGP